MKNMMESISQCCPECQSYSATPSRFRATAPPEEVTFNVEVHVDLVRLEELPILHVVDTHKRFQGAVLLRSKSAEPILDAFLECWYTLYVG